MSPPTRSGSRTLDLEAIAEMLARTLVPLRKDGSCGTTAAAMRRTSLPPAV